VKVVEISTYIMESPGREYVFVKVQTDEGIHGWGEATLEMKQSTVAAAVHDLQGFVLGEDPTRVDFLWQRMYRQGFWRGGVAILSGISAIEQALWDITGKAYGLPVYKLLGGAVRDYIPCYTHCGDPQRARQFMEDGWRAFKFGLGTGRASPFVDREAVRATVRQAEALRQAVGDDVELMCDAHGRLRPPVAIRLGKALEPANLLFYEEPVPPDNVLALKTVRAAGLSTDLATGERAFTRWGYRELIENQLVDVIQPDICHDGGIKETLKIAAMAETYNIVVAPHNPNGPVATAASVHAAACMPNFLILEYATSATRDVCQAGDVFKAVNGRIELPTKPGLGIELDEDYLAHHPYQGIKLWPSLRYPDGSIADV
jgi:galactonate dehydratase